MQTYSDPTALIQSFNGAGKPLHVLFALILSKRLYNTVSQISGLVGCDRETASIGLKRLSSLNLVTLTPHGWVLTQNGRQLILTSPQFLQAPATSGAALPSETHSPTSQGQRHFSACGEIPHGACIGMPENSTSDGDSSTYVEESGTLKEEEENQEYKLINPPPPPKCGEIPHLEPNTLERIQRLIEATAQIWTRPLLPNCIEPFKTGQFSEDDLLAKIAEIYHAGRYSSPAGVVYKAFAGHPCRLAPKKYYEHPEQYLPSGFLRAAGLQEFLPAPEVETNDAPIADDPCDAEPAGDPSLDERVGNMTPAKAWASVKGHLQQEMQKSTYDAWVRDTRPLRFVEGALIVGTPSDISRAWLQERLTSTATRLLTGLLNRTVEVGFEVAP